MSRYVDPKANTYSLIEFHSKYGTDESCEQALYQLKSKITAVTMQKYDPKSGDGRLKWLHVMVSNIKANIEGAYHGLEGTYLQRYLDEFCYRFNRRHSKKHLFDHLLACRV